MSMPIVFLMYHELELEGRRLSESGPGYTRYVIPTGTFRAQMQWLHVSGFRGLTVSEALTFPTQPAVAITFDDGSETDLLAAAPILREFGFGATFYITAGFLGKKGYLSRVQLNELSDAGLEIGSHSMSHGFLSEMEQAQIQRETAESKKVLEDITGEAVKHFSCPGGRYDRRVCDAVRDARYSSMSTSRSCANRASTDRFELGRVAIMRQTSSIKFQRICTGRGLLGMRIAETARSGVRTVLGNSAYETIRRIMLGTGQAASSKT